MAHQPGRGYNYNHYGTSVPQQPPGSPHLPGVHSFDQGDDGQNPANVNGNRAAAPARGHRSSSSAASQNAELFYGNDRPVAYPPRTTSHSSNSGVGYASQPLPPIPQHQQQQYDQHRYNPQQYGAPPPTHHSPQASMNNNYSPTPSHQPYVPAAYQQHPTHQYTTGYGAAAPPTPQQVSYQSIAQSQSQTGPAPPLPPPPPPRPHASPEASQSAAFATELPSIPYRPQQPPLPTRVVGHSPSSSSTQSYTPPAPPPPPFSPLQDAYAPTPSTASGQQFATRTSSTRPPSQYNNTTLPPILGASSTGNNGPRVASPQIHRRPVPPSSSGFPTPNTRSSPSTPGTPITPGPPPPPHSPQRPGTLTQHPQARPLPGPPPQNAVDNDYFSPQQNLYSGGSQPSSGGGGGRHQTPGFDDLMQEVEAAVMEGRPSPGTSRTPAHGSIDETQGVQPLRPSQTQVYDLEPDNIYGHTNGHDAVKYEEEAEDDDSEEGEEEETSADQEEDSYSVDSDDEAEGGLQAMHEAEEQEAREKARVRGSGSAPQRLSQGSARQSLGGYSREQQPQDLSSDSDVPVDMSTYGGGFPGNVYYGGDHLSRGQYANNVDNQGRPFTETRLPQRSDVSDGSSSEIYAYPLPGQDYIHPFAPARVDTGGTGGLAEPSAQSRRLSFEDGDETTLAESEDNYTSGTQSPASGVPDMFFHPGPGRPLPAAPIQSPSQQTVPQLMPISVAPNQQHSQQSRLLHYDQYGRPTYPAAPDAYDTLLSPSGTVVPRSTSLNSGTSSSQMIVPIRSKTDADRARILREQQRLGLGTRSGSLYGSDALGSGVEPSSAELLQLPEIPVGKRGKFNPAKLSTSDFKKCAEPWALGSIDAWIKEMCEGEVYLKENMIVDGIVALFTHKVPTMNTADAETLGAKVVQSMFSSRALVKDEEWVKFGMEPMSGVVIQLTGTGCYSPRVHDSNSPGFITHEKPNRCYSHHCMRTLKKINLSTQLLEPQRKVEDWATFYKLKKQDVEGVDKKTIERQNVLHEIVTSEDIFMDQLDVIRVLYRDTLAKTTPPIIDPKRRDAFLNDVFNRADLVKQVNEDYLLGQLKYRQQEQGPWITGFSDIFREWIRKARNAYVEYSTHYPHANLKIRQESDRNVLFRQYLEHMRDNEKSKRLGWDSYLKAPITRLQRYSLLLSTVHKNMLEGSEEKTNLAKAIDEIKGVTRDCDSRVDEMSKHVQLAELATKLQLRPGMEKVQLNLTHLGREILFEGDLQRTGSNKFTWLDCHAILFDHYLVLAKTIEKRDAAGGLKSEKYDVSKIPIPMDLLVLETRNDAAVVKSSVKGIGAVTTKVSVPAAGDARLPSSTAAAPSPYASTPSQAGPGTLQHAHTASSAASIQTNSSGRAVHDPTVIDAQNENVMYPFRVRHLGRPEVYVLYAPSSDNREDWCNKIIEAKTRHAASLYKQNAEPFKLRVVADTAFAYDAMTGMGKSIIIKGTPLDRAIRQVEKLYEGSGQRPMPVCRAAVNCATTFTQPYGIPMIAVGTDFGVYTSDVNNPRGWTRAIAATRVVQIAVLEEFSLMIVISDKSLIAHHLDTVCPHPSGTLVTNNNSDASSRRAPQKLSGARDVGFFAHGRMKDRQLVIYKKRDGISSNFKVLEPVYQKSSQSVVKSRFGIRKGTTEFFRDFDEFYIPSETYAVNLFVSTLAIATAKGFEVMTLDKKVPLSIPDLKAPECASIAQRLSNQKPLGMFRLSDSEFLLVFEEVGIYVNKHGDVSRAVVMEFVGRAKQACLAGGMYLILVDHGSGFVEVRNATSGRLRQVISGKEVKLLDDGGHGKGGSVKICMQHPEYEKYQIIVELIAAEGVLE